jgi:hypothetical protein
VIQRFGGGLNLNVHFHTLAFDGVFVRSPARPLEFQPALPPSDAEVEQVLGTIRRWVERLLRRRGLEPGEADTGPEDPLAEASLALAGIKRAWSDGTTHLLFEPVEFLEKLAALTPRPEINLALYHGVLAPHARWRPDVVAYRRAETGGGTEGGAAMGGTGTGRGGAAKPRYWTWAALMRWAFDLEVLRCPRCAGRMRLLATIDDPVVLQKILAQVGLPSARDGPRLPCALSGGPAEPPALPGVTP